MPDLPLVVAQALRQFESGIIDMRRGMGDGRMRPHKLLMLLAVLDIAERGHLPANRIYLNDELTQAFENYFHLVSDDDDWCQPGPPFFHLRSSPFWFHKVKVGREAAYESLTTSGGGTKRIHDNIEYAYLSDDTYLVVSDPEARQDLRRFISAKLNEKSKPVTQKLGTVFHETFSLSRPALSQVIAQIAQCPEGVDLSSAKQRDEYLRSSTNLGTRYVKAMPRYGLAAGLLRPDTYRLTDFGRRVSKLDPLLDRSATQWLIHYFLCVPHALGPSFWGELVATRFAPGNEFDKKALEDELSSYILKTEGKSLGERSIGPTTTVFLGTYTKSDGLGGLGLIEESPSAGSRYTVLEPEPPPVWAFGIALLDYWHANYPERAGIHLDELYGDHSLGRLFLMGPGRINAYLRDLQDEGYVEIFRVAPPYRLMLLRQDEEPLWHKLYAPDPTG